MKLLFLLIVGIIGILVNMFLVLNYLCLVDVFRKRIVVVNKKSYMVVVGKLNLVKLVNFVEIDGWVVVGCWESSFVEDDVGFFRLVVMLFELEVVLMGDWERVWGGSWWGGIEGVKVLVGKDEEEEVVEGKEEEDEDSEEEFVLLEFDFRIGRLISISWLMRVRKVKEEREGGEVKEGVVEENMNGMNGVFVLRLNVELVMVNGVVSLGVEFLRL